LALTGATVGAAISWALFNGNTVNLGDSTGSIVFKMQMTPALLMLGVVLACTLGFIGGLLPAVRAARLPVATALRAV
jgi:putative ABC transport system permease protein